MKKILVFAIVLLSGVNAWAQHDEISTKGCATITTQEEMDDLYRFVHSEQPTFKGTGSADTIPLTIHLVGDNNGAGHYDTKTLFKMLCRLNERFVPTGFFFYIKWPIRFINNSNYYNHDYSWGYQMMATNNVANTVNVYFVQDPAGACGYFSYGGDAVAIAKSCASINSTTLTHELGHFFGLPHTFNGWENGQTPSNPEKVTRGAGANCSTAGDLFCDTEADFLSTRWYCPYVGGKLDANGDRYRPDSSIYMSYSVDACMSRFSTQQNQRMKNRLYTNRSNLLYPAPAFGAISDTAKILFPVDTMFANQKYLKWNKVPGATHYMVKMRSTYWLSNIQLDTVITDTAIAVTFNAPSNNYPYTYFVTPLNGANTCLEHEAERSFIYNNGLSATSVINTTLADAHFIVAPNPVSANKLQVSFTAQNAQPLTLTLYSINGATLATQQYDAVRGFNTYQMPLPNVPKGVYFIQLKGEYLKATQKVIVE